jgi:RNA polymerase-interacting CarD/CdnL/TRCF family regulator
VLKSLLVLSFQEKKMLDRARQMLITELSISCGLREPDVIDLLQKALAKASAALPMAL